MEQSFFDFRSKLLSSTFQVFPLELNYNEHEDDSMNLIKGNYTDISFPVIFKQECGNRLEDILYTGCVTLYLISDRMKFILEKNNITGWKTFPIVVHDKKGKEVVGYHGFSITGRCDLISYENSKIIEKKYVPTGPIVRYYVGAEVENWGGTDFFTPQNTYQILVTKKTADLLKENKITNVDLTSLEEFDIEVSSIKKSRDT